MPGANDNCTIAYYDSNGDIILSESTLLKYYQQKDDIGNCAFSFGGTEQNAPTGSLSAVLPPSHDAARLLHEARESIAIAVHGVIEETADQYQHSLHAIKHATGQLAAWFRSAGTKLWAFLTQPVWVLHKKRKPRQYNRLSLFVFDTVHFGVTFTLLFLALFFSLNYQSYWQIFISHINPIQVQTRQLQASLGSERSLETIVNTPAIDREAYKNGELLAFLPMIGPPGKRIIIPKLNINAPIIDPPIDALLKEDWAQLENDIQDALAEGIVRYPGTAEPGKPGNAFFTGHSSYYPWKSGLYKSIFARLHELEPGDEYFVYFNGDKFRYRVTDKKEVRPSDVSVLDQPVSKRISTLMTCTPLGTTLRRLVVQAEEVDLHTAQIRHVSEHEKTEYRKIDVKALPI